MPRDGWPKPLIPRTRPDRAGGDSGAARRVAYKLSEKATFFVYGAFHTALPSRSASSRLGLSVGLVASETCGLPGSVAGPRLAPGGGGTRPARRPGVAP